MPTVINIEPTPNPNAIKYLLDAPLTGGESRSFPDPASAGADPLAAALFALPGVTSVFYMDRFVTISKTADASFHALHPRIMGAIEGNGAPAAAPAIVAEPFINLQNLTPAQQAMMEKINAVLDSDVRPALAGDGGGLVVMGLEGNLLKIKYQGACGSCPSSTAGTIAAIQNVLRFKVSPELSVVPA